MAVSRPATRPELVLVDVDYCAGAYYIVIGTLWVYFVVRLIQSAFKRREHPAA
jgi:hypothetical protein